MLPAETDIALYAEDTDEHKKWMAFDSEMTDLANDKQIQITTTAGDVPASADITSLINGCQKENGFLVLKIFNRKNSILKFSSSNLKVTYKDGYTAPDYLGDINNAMSAADMEAGNKAKKIIEGITKEVEAGEIYTGKVTRIMDFGAFVEILPNKEGLCHISQLDHKRVNKVEDVVSVGDEIVVKVSEIDKMGRINLSRKAALPKPENKE